MERAKVVVSSGINGAVIKLPIGFRFQPTDEELVVHYLKRKVNSSPLPACVIPEFDDVAQTNPWDLPGDWKEKRYFFSKRKGEEKYICKRMSSSGCGCGYWKAIGKEKHIVAARLTKEAPPPPPPAVVVGLKKTLLFYQAVGNHPLPTNWVMHQYRLLPTQTTPNNSSQRVAMKMEDWVVCCIYEKKRKGKNDDGLKSHRLISNRSCNNNVNVTKKMQRGFMKEDISSSNQHHHHHHHPQPTTSSTSSSGITDLSSNGSHHHHHQDQDQDQDQDQEDEASSADQLCFSSYISRIGGKPFI